MTVAERFTGARVKRSEDPRILTGLGRYVDDIHLPGMVHAAFVRSYLPHARINRVDATEARGARGVVAVFTGAELETLVVPGLSLLDVLGLQLPTPAFSVLATDKVRLVGDPVALVVAESRYLAEDACELIEVEYDELTPIATARQGLDPASPPIFDDLGQNVMVGPTRTDYADVREVFARSDRVLHFEFSQHRHQNVPLECRGIVADFDPATDVLTIHSAVQGVHLTRTLLASRLGLDPDNVRVLAGDIGGSFGLKVGAYREDIACAAAAKHLGRPVKWIEDRTENLTASGHAREESFDLDVAITNDGRILGLNASMLMDIGAYPGVGVMVCALIEGMLPGPYQIEALSFEYTTVMTNKASYVAYRGPWAAETWVRERTIDLVARELDLEPLEVRRRNVVNRDQPPLEMITGRSLAGVTARESIERIGEILDVAEFRRRQAAAREEGRYLGLGFATYIEAAPGPRNQGVDAPPLGAEEIRMTLDDDGVVNVYTVQMPHGQGHQTTLAQIAADEFGVPFDQVRVVVGDTASVPQGFGTGGSMSATMTGGATLHAARLLRDRVLRVAAHMFEARVDDLEMSNGLVNVVGVPARAMTLTQIAAAAAAVDDFPPDMDTSLEVSKVFDGGQGGWSGGTHGAVVEVDIETGHVTIERYVVVEDCGELINPAIVEGQIRGGVAQGIGAVLLERSAYDEKAQYLSGTFMDYLLPTASEVPPIEIEHLATVPLDADVNFRGIGEGGMIVAPPTICNAIEDALAPLGMRVYEQHLPPLRIKEMLTGAAS